MPENALLSHDLFEGLHARTALVSDVEVVDDYPARTSSRTRAGSTAGCAATGRSSRGSSRSCRRAAGSREPAAARSATGRSSTTSGAASSRRRSRASSPRRGRSSPGNPLVWTLGGLAVVALPARRLAPAVPAESRARRAVRVFVRGLLEEICDGRWRRRSSRSRFLPFHAWEMVARDRPDARARSSSRSGDSSNGRPRRPRPRGPPGSSSRRRARVRRGDGGEPRRRRRDPDRRRPRCAPRPCRSRCRSSSSGSPRRSSRTGSAVPRVPPAWSSRAEDRELLLAVARRPGTTSRRSPAPRITGFRPTTSRRRRSPASRTAPRRRTSAWRSSPRSPRTTSGSSLDAMVERLERRSRRSKRSSATRATSSTGTTRGRSRRSRRATSRPSTAATSPERSSRSRRAAARSRGRTRALAPRLAGPRPPRGRASRTGCASASSSDPERQLFSIGYRLADAGGPGAARLRDLRPPRLRGAPRELLRDRQGRRAAGPLVPPRAARRERRRRPDARLVERHDVRVPDAAPPHAHVPGHAPRPDLPHGREAADRLRAHARRAVGNLGVGVPPGGPARAAFQYKAFGVPGLGLKRGLADELVVAPYATALAALVDPVQRRPEPAAPRATRARRARSATTRRSTTRRASPPSPRSRLSRSGGRRHPGRTSRTTRA